MKLRSLFTVGVVLVLASCGADLSGTYQGQEVISGSSNTGFNSQSQVQFNLTQSGSTVQGSFQRTVSNGGQNETGTVTGTVSGNSLNVTLYTNSFSNFTSCTSSQGTLTYDNGRLTGVTTGSSGQFNGQNGGQNGGQNNASCTFNYSLVQTSGAGL